MGSPVIKGSELRPKLWDLKIAIVRRTYSHFLRPFYLRYPIIGYSVGPIDMIELPLLAVVGANVFPDNIAGRRYFQQPAAATFSNKSISVGQTLGRADESTV